MFDQTGNKAVRKALVLGGGGVAGIAWEAGLLSGLRTAGVDLSDADLFVGTSAGSVVGAFLAHGLEPSDAVLRMAERSSARNGSHGTGSGGSTGSGGDGASAPVNTAEPAPPSSVTAGAEMNAMADTNTGVDLNAVMTAFGLLFDPALDPRQARAQVGRMALDAPVARQGARLRAIGDWLPGDHWPERRLLVTAVDTSDGEFVVWDGASRVPLSLAVMSSCAVPCVFPPVEVNGGRYMDGGTRSLTNADLARGAESVVVLEPMAHVFPRARVERELRELGTDAVVAVAPDRAAIEVFGVNVLDDALWGPAFEAGLAQAPALTGQVEAVWNG